MPQQCISETHPWIREGMRVRLAPGNNSDAIRLYGDIVFTARWSSHFDRFILDDREGGLYGGMSFNGLSYGARWEEAVEPGELRSLSGWNAQVGDVFRFNSPGCSTAGSPWEITAIRHGRYFNESGPLVNDPYWELVSRAGQTQRGTIIAPPKTKFAGWIRKLEAKSNA